MSTATSKLRSVLHTHEPWYDSFDQNADSWGCTCDRRTGYYTRGEVIEKHILPLVRAAAMEEAKTKLARIFTKAGLDLEAILKSEEAFGKPEPATIKCTCCGGRGTHRFGDGTLSECAGCQGTGTVEKPVGYP